MKTLLFRMHTRAARAYGLALALALLALPAIDGAAKEARYSAFGCMTDNGTPFLLFELQNISPTSSLVVYCPIADTDAFQKRNIKTLNVHGYNGENGSTFSPVRAQVCVTRWHTHGVSCGPASTANGKGNYTLTPDLSAWKNNLVDFGYLFMTLPPATGQGTSTIRGYFTSDKPGA